VCAGNEGGGGVGWAYDVAMFVSHISAYKLRHEGIMRNRDILEFILELCPGWSVVVSFTVYPIDSRPDTH